MRKIYFKTKDRTLNFDWIDDEWLWLFEPEPKIEPISWTDQDILMIYECLLENSIRNLLDPRCSIETITEIYQWISKDNDPNPFSFEMCCILNGINPEQMRETLLIRLRKSKRMISLH